MTVFNPITASFSAGVLSPSFIGRRDTKLYYAGLRVSKNYMITPTGAATRRPPTKLLDHSESINVFNGDLIPFQSAPDKSYLIDVQPNALSGLTFIIYRRNAGVTTQVHSFSTLISSDADGWEFARFAQSRDVMYIALDGTTKVKKLTRIAETNWTFEDVDEKDGPWQDINLLIDVRMKPNAKNATTIQAQDENDAAVNYFVADDVGRLIRIRHNFDPDGNTGIHWGYARIDSLVGAAPADTVNVTTLEPFGKEDDVVGGPRKTKNWQKGLFPDNSTGNVQYPTVTEFHQNRQVYAKDNQTLASIANDFEKHSPTLPDDAGIHLATPDAGINLKMADLRAADINWLASDQVLHIGTNDGRWVLTSPDNTFEPGNLSFVKQSNVGCANIDPILVDNIIYARFDKEAIFGAEFNFTRNRFEDKNLNIYSDTILTPKVAKLAYTSYPFNIIWCLLENGKLAALTYDTEQKILAWSNHEIDGYDIYDMVALKAEDEKEVLYFKAQNTTSGVVNSALLEMDLSSWDYLKTDTATTNPLTDAYQMRNNQTVFTDLDHLDGKTPIVLIDGVNYEQTGTVTNGNFTIQDNTGTGQDFSGDFEIGIPMQTELQPMPIDIPANNETQMGKVKGIKDLQVQMLNTGSLQAKATSVDGTETGFEDFEFRKAGDPVDAVPPLFTGQKHLPLDNSSDEDITIVFSQNKQAPCTILGFSYEVNIEA